MADLRNNPNVAGGLWQTGIGAPNKQISESERAKVVGGLWRRQIGQTQAAGDPGAPLPQPIAVQPALIFPNAPVGMRPGMGAGGMGVGTGTVAGGLGGAQLVWPSMPVGGVGSGMASVLGGLRVAQLVWPSMPFGGVGGTTAFVGAFPAPPPPERVRLIDRTFQPTDSGPAEEASFTEEEIVWIDEEVGFLLDRAAELFSSLDADLSDDLRASKSLLEEMKHDTPSRLRVGKGGNFDDADRPSGLTRVNPFGSAVIWVKDTHVKLTDAFMPCERASTTLFAILLHELQHARKSGTGETKIYEFSHKVLSVLAADVPDNPMYRDCTPEQRAELQAGFSAQAKSARSWVGKRREEGKTGEKREHRR